MSLRMYDTADHGFQGGIPANAEAITCYGDRRFQNVGAAQARFPHLFAQKRVLVLSAGRLAVPPINGLDWEPGNTNPDVASWYQDSISHGTWRPVIYADLSDMKNLIPALTNTIGPLANPGPGRPVRIFTAHPTGTEHICGPNTCGQLPWEADITQWWWSSIQGHGQGDFDISDCRTDAFETAGPVSPVGDMHYDWYDEHRRKLCRNTVERDLVKRYDVLRAQQRPTHHPHQGELSVIREQLKLHADRIASLMIKYAPKGKHLETKRDRYGWRYYRIMRRVQGDLVHP